MERRLLIAVVLSFIVVFASSYFMPKKVTPPAKNGVATTQQTADGSAATAPISEPASAATTDTTAAEALPPTEALKDVTVKTGLYTAVFTNYGARLKSFKMHDYKVTQEPDSELIDMVTVTDLTHLPLDVQMFGANNAQFLTGSELFNVAAGTLDVAQSPSNNRLVFSTKTKGGLKIDKVFTFSNDDYNVDIELKVTNQSGKATTGKMNINWVERFDKEQADRATVLEAFAFAGKDVERSDHKDLGKKEMLITGDIKWSGISNKFFMVAFVPERAESTSFYANSIGNDMYLLRSSSDTIVLNPNEEQIVKYKVYIGPKRSENLKPYGVGLQGAINYGFFSVISVPLMWLLKLFYSFTHNYGTAIILLTILIKIAFFPLTQKSYKAMNDMKKLSPLLAELKEKYKEDKERLNKEVLALYKKHRVNPVGGCFPMLLQMPVFLALYKALMISVELRHAPFYFWITDLSSKDPYYVTPIIMGITMFLQQKMSPTSGDKTQQKMMLLMPVVFTFMFLNFASGLVIYWLMNNILSIFQQAAVQKKQA